MSAAQWLGFNPGSTAADWVTLNLSFKASLELSFHVMLVSMLVNVKRNIIKIHRETDGGGD